MACEKIAGFKYTEYPCAIDSSDELPKAIDSVTGVNAEVVNRHREAIIAIESELGVQPSGTYATVRARLDALELAISSITSSSVVVQNNGVTTVLTGRILNFTGDITVTAVSGVQADINVVASGDPGGQETLAETLAFGDTTSGEHITITNGDYIEFPGAIQAATTGQLRIAQGFVLSGRDVANSNNRTLVSWSSDDFTLGHTSHDLVLVGSDITINNLVWPTADGSDGYALVTDGAGNLSFAAVSGSGGGESLAQTLAIGSTTSGQNITITSGDYVEFPGAAQAATTGQFRIAQGFVLSGRDVADANNRTLIDWSSDSFAVGNLNHSSVFTGLVASLSGSLGATVTSAGTTTVTSSSTTNISSDGSTNISSNATTDIDGPTVIIKNLTWPNSDGEDGYVLTTDGAGNLAFEPAAQGGQETLAETLAFGNTTSGQHITITNGDYVEFPGAAQAATTGQFRIAQGFVLSGRDVANSNDRVLISWTSDDLIIGHASHDSTLNGLTANITTSGDINITSSGGVITINGTVADIDSGTVIIKGLVWPSADGSPNQVLKTDGAGNLFFGTDAGSGGGGAQSLAEVLAIGNTTDGYDIIISNGDVIKGSNNTNGSDLVLQGGVGVSGIGGNVVIEPGVGSTEDGYLILDGLNWPQVDGNDGYVLKTDGTGNLSFASVGSLSALPVNVNKDMDANLTDGDGYLGTNTPILLTPANGSYVDVRVNGVGVTLGNGVKTKESYFSSDNGTNALPYREIVAGSYWYWNGNVANFDLDSSDRIDFHYVSFDGYEENNILLSGTWSGYLDADFDTTIDTGVSLWTSQDGTINASQGTGANQPLLLTDWLGSGRKALDFDGSSHYLSFDDFATLITGDVSFRWAMHLSLDLVNPSGTDTVWGVGNTSGTSNWRRLYNDNSGTRLSWASNDGSTESELYGVGDLTQDTEYVVNGHYNATSHTFSMWRNGSKLFDEVTHNKSCPVNVAAIGALPRNTVTLFLDGKIRRFAFGLGTFSDGDTTTLQGWLGT